MSKGGTRSNSLQKPDPEHRQRGLAQVRRRGRLGRHVSGTVASVVAGRLATTTGAVKTGDSLSPSAGAASPSVASGVCATAQPPAPPSVALPSGWDCTWSTGAMSDPGFPIAQSSPIVADLDGQQSVVVGDRKGSVYAYHLNGTGTPTSVAGWPTANGGIPIDSTPSIVPVAGGRPTVVVGSGNDANPTTGGFQAYTSGGAQKWFTPVENPASDSVPASGVKAGITVGDLGSAAAGLVAGSLGQVSYALRADNGVPLKGWPFFNSDSTHGTAALADLYGTGKNEIIMSGDQSAGQGRGRSYSDGGHLRVLTGDGNQVCRADTNQVADSSPAVGGFLSGGRTGIVMGTGDYFPGASDTNTVKAYDTSCHLQWSSVLDGNTLSSPALSDVLGNGSLQVVEGTDQALAGTGSVWVLDATTGQTIWKATGIGRVIGSVVTADLTGGGYADVLVPTTHGTYVYNGRTGEQIAVLSENLGLQNSPLVTNDPNGTIGITLAGLIGVVPGGVGQIDHYEIQGSNGAAAVGPGTWPMFHHDPQLTGNAGRTTPPGSIPACSIPAAALGGYRLAASDGGVFSYGGAPFCGSMGSEHLNAPVVGFATAASTGGYWEVASDGGIFAFGGAEFFGSMGGRSLNKPIVGIAAVPDGTGYWEVASDGGIFAFGSAAFYGSMGGSKLNQPVVAIAASADGAGYRMVASDGGIFVFGDAAFSGSEGGKPLNKPIVGTTNDDDTGGYWEVASDGGIFAFGGARFFGSTGNLTLAAPVVGIASTANGSGYRMVASDGGVFSFDAPFLGSMGGSPLSRPIVGMTSF